MTILRLGLRTLKSNLDLPWVSRPFPLPFPAFLKGEALLLAVGATVEILYLQSVEVLPIEARIITLHNFIVSNYFPRSCNSFYSTDLVSNYFLGYVVFFVLVQSIPRGHRIALHICFGINLPGNVAHCYITEMVSKETRFNYVTISAAIVWDTVLYCKRTKPSIVRKQLQL